MSAVGSIVGAYRLEAELGEGGCGKVFRAAHVLLGRQVAVKVLNDELASDQGFVSRFFHEAKIVNEIKHRNIIDVIDFIQEPRCVAYVMELLEGVPLSRAIASGDVTPTQALNATLQIAAALKAVHAKRVIHRDLKPENIFVLAPMSSDWSSIPSVKVLDFGVAKFAADEVEHRTATGAVVGTPLYMAPEQIWAAAVSPATDVYALGEILYELLAGRRLFEGTRSEVLKQKVEASPRARLQFSELPDGDVIGSLVRRCIAVSPEARPSLDEVGAIVASFLSGGPQWTPVPNPVSAPGLGPSLTSPARPSAKSDPYSSQPRLEDLAPQSTSTPLPATTPQRLAMPAQAIATPAQALSGSVVAPRPKGRGLAIAGGALALTAALTLGLVGLRGEEEARPLAPEPAASPSMVDADAVEVTSEPPGASVVDPTTELDLGKTPARIALPGGRARSVRLVLDGHQPVILPLDASHPSVRVVMLPSPSGAAAVAPSVAAQPPKPVQRPTQVAESPAPVRKTAPRALVPKEPLLAKPAAAPATAPTTPQGGASSKVKPLRKDETTQW